MGKITALICFLMSSAVFAAPAGTNAFDMKMDLSLKGKHVGSPQVVSVAGEKATVIIDSKGGKKTYVDIVATDEPSETGGKPGIFMKFEVGTVSATGKKTVLLKPRIIAVENEKAQISQTDSNGAQQFSLSVVVKRKAL